MIYFFYGCGAFFDSLCGIVVIFLRGYYCDFCGWVGISVLYSVWIDYQCLYIYGVVCGGYFDSWCAVFY